MPRLEFFVVAESLSIDQATNELSIFNIWEEVRSPGFPLIIPKCAAISLWRSEPNDAGQDWTAAVRVTPPGEPTIELPITFRFAENELRHRITQRIQGIPVQREGDLHFELVLSGKHIAEHIITVQRVEEIDIPGRPASSDHNG